MKKNVLVSAFFVGLCFFMSVRSFGQGEVYTTSAAEIIFSWADISINGQEPSSILRWSPVLNIGTLMHYDLDNNRVGLFTGLDIKNVGLIFNDPNDNGNLHIHRTYNLGIPIALKIGNLENVFVYGGYQIEFPFNYKHKYWAAEDRSGAKTKQVEWFSGPVQTQQAWLAGVQLKGVNIKFKYYMTNFFKQSYSEGGVEPFAEYEANIMYLSIAANMFKNAKFYSY